jgi:hypothetical protein
MHHRRHAPRRTPLLLGLVLAFGAAAVPVTAWTDTTVVNGFAVTDDVSAAGQPTSRVTTAPIAPNLADIGPGIDMPIRTCL